LNGEANTARTKQISAIIASTSSLNRPRYGFRYTQDALLLFLDWFSKNEHCLTPMSFAAPIIIYGKRTCFGDMPLFFRAGLHTR